MGKSLSSHWMCLFTKKRRQTQMHGVCNSFTACKVLENDRKNWDHQLKTDKKHMQPSCSGQWQMTMVYGRYNHYIS